MTYSIAMIAPTQVLGQANALCAEHGWGEESFLVPLSPTGSAPATHFGLRASANAAFAADLAEAIAADPALSGQMSVDLREDAERQGQFEAVIAAAGLSRIEGPPMPEQ